ncbi:patatin-like phospholipase domain-containing protein 2 [Lingula anatina]|uniref:triacylglycerol lipase n=1 Tax=Lingula anatina TaxID=7574 RepID=A0A1S3KGF0_LINAN|nr:patatin-like phospholipase domain-containing protein 2 [Lingula anatina]|eukprot:XP_013421713.1 patatin-like phospholipase domain-containing protein 2 [Lingula anatina]
MNISFAGCGFLGIYHVGVSSCLRVHSPHLLDDPNFKLLGASAGAIAAVCLISGCPLGECTNYVLRVATKARSRSLGPLHPSFNIVKLLQDGLNEILPPNAHEICTNRVYISMTRVSDRANIIVSQYDTKEDLIQALLCSAHIPFYSGLLPPAFKGVRCVDGCLSDNLPVFDENTVTVSPFCGETDICPDDNSANFLHVNLANTSMQCTSNNLYRLSRALFPPHPEILSEMCRQGFDDALKYLQRNTLISCVRHFSIKSSISQCPPESQVSGETSDYDSESDLDDHDDHDPDTCHECKKKVQVALIDSLPLPVAGALQAACDSMNSNIYTRLTNRKTFRLLSLMTSPLTLPVEMIFHYSVRFLEWVPYLPADVRWTIREFVQLIQLLRHKIEHNRHQYSARFTCQLAISDAYDAEEPGYVPDTQSDYKTYTASKHLRHWDICVERENSNPYDVPLPCHDPIPQIFHRVSHIRHKLEEDHHHHLEVHARNPHRDFHGEISTGSPIGGSPHKDDMCEQLVDTFEHCLHEANQQEAVLAYYYLDEDQKLKVTEIFSVVADSSGAGTDSAFCSDTSKNITSSPLSLSTSPKSQLELSWDNYVEMKSDGEFGYEIGNSRWIDNSKNDDSPIEILENPRWMDDLLSDECPIEPYAHTGFSTPEYDSDEILSDLRQSLEETNQQSTDTL